MADKNKTPEAPETAGDLRGTLIKRLAVAGGLAALLLGILALFDYLASSDEPEGTVYTAPVPLPPKKEHTQPVKSVESLPEPPKSEVAAERPAEPSPPALPAPAAPNSVASHPAAPNSAASSPAAPSHAVAAPAVPAAAPSVPRGRSETKMPAKSEAPLLRAPVAHPEPAAVPEATSAPARMVEEPRPTTPPAAPAPQRAVESPRAPETPAPARLAPAHLALTPIRIVSGYVLKAGVFANAQRAEELHARLTLNGIPSTLEARVQVGPFKSREEALAAQEKMRSLGIDAVLVPPAPGRR